MRQFRAVNEDGVERTEAVRREVSMSRPLEVLCPCGAQFTLWMNGGELDSHDCKCGRFHRLEHIGVQYVRYEPV